MLLFKILFVLLVIFLFFLWWKHKLIQRLKQDIGEDMKRHGYRPGAVQTREEKMVRCSRCEMFVPISDASMYDGKFYCCEEHTKPPYRR